VTSGASGARVPPHLEVKSPLPQLLSKAHRSGLAGRDLVMIVLTYVHTSRSKSRAQSHPFPAAPAARLSNTHDRTILRTSVARLSSVATCCTPAPSVVAPNVAMQLSMSPSVDGAGGREGAIAPAWAPRSEWATAQPWAWQSVRLSAVVWARQMAPQRRRIILRRVRGRLGRPVRRRVRRRERRPICRRRLRGWNVSRPPKMPE
jgi:hypothetical protein